MKIIYIANIRFPTERAHGIQIAKTCEAFAALGAEVELVVTNRATGIAEDAQTYFNLRRAFPIRRVRVPDIVRRGRIGFLIESMFFALGARTYAGKGVVYCRDEWVLALLILLGVRTAVWESHTGAWNAAARFVARRASALVPITQGLSDFYAARGIPRAKMLVAPDGVSAEEFTSPAPKEDVRKRLGLPANAKVALYIGGLDGWKGADTVYATAEKLPKDVVVAVIGGKKEDVPTLSEKHPRVRFLGPRPYTELPDNQAAADVLILPNTGASEISVRFTSPLKLFTYMASGVPIVTSDLPSIREVVDEKSAFFVPADNPHALAEGIMQVLGNTEDAARRAVAARALIPRYTWAKRAERILAFLEAPSFAKASDGQADVIGYFA